MFPCWVVRTALCGFPTPVRAGWAAERVTAAAFLLPVSRRSPACIGRPPRGCEGVVGVGQGHRVDGGGEVVRRGRERALVLSVDRCLRVLGGHVPGCGVAELPGVGAGCDGAGEQVHADGPVADQDRADVAVVEDDATAAAVAGEPGGDAPAVFVGSGYGAAAVTAQRGVGGFGEAWWLPAVLVDPVRDRVLGDSWAVVGVAEAAADLVGEAPSFVRAAGGEAPPVQRPDRRGDLDGFWVGRGRGALVGVGQSRSWRASRPLIGP
jgi:hypothetical protein